MIGPPTIPGLLGGTLLVLIGAGGVLGWLGGVRALTSVRPEFIPIAPNTAVSFLILGLAVGALTLPSRRALLAARAGAAAVLLVATIRLAEYLAGVPASVDDWLIAVRGEHVGLAPVGRMAFATAVTMLLGSVALLGSTLPPRHRVMGDVVRALALLVTLVGMAFLLGYGYGAPLRYGTDAIPMALPTAVGFIVLGISIALPAMLRERADRRSARRALQVAHDALEQRVAERTAALERANEGLHAGLQRLQDQSDSAEAATLRARRAEERFRTLIEGLGVGVLLVTPDGVEASNSAAARILRVDPEQLHAAGLFEEWHAVRPDGTPVRDDQLPGLLALRTGEPQRDVVLGLRRPDGSLVWIEVWAEPLTRPGEPAPYAVTISFADVTARTALEEQLRHAQKMEGIGQLAGGIAHDFNNMLTAIKSFTELVLEELRPGDRHHAELSEVKAAADRAAGLTRQLLAFSRRQILQPVVLDLNGVIESAHRMLARLVGPDIRCETVLERNLWLVRADPGQLEQVLMNLVVNARDAMPDGGTLTLRSANVRIVAEAAGQVADALPGDYVVLTIRDTGVGMTSESQRRIFEPFFTTKPHGVGTGLGLPMVYGIVQQSGGFLTVESEPGAGSVFSVHLPRVWAGRESVHPPDDDPAVSAPGGTETILLVEDDEAVRRVADRILVRNGYRVIQAHTPTAARELFARDASAIDLVVTDLMLPEASGRELVEELRASYPGLRVLYMSGYTSDEVIQRGLLEPGMAFVPKPFTVEAFARGVRTALDAPRADPVA